MVLLPFLIVSSCRIVYRFVFRAVPIFAGRLVLFSSRRLFVSLCAPCQRVIERAAVCDVLHPVCRIDKQAEASRHRIDKLAVLRHEHHVIISSVVPCCPSGAL